MKFGPSMMIQMRFGNNVNLLSKTSVLCYSSGNGKNNNEDYTKTDPLKSFQLVPENDRNFYKIESINPFNNQVTLKHFNAQKSIIKMSNPFVLMGNSMLRWNPKGSLYDIGNYQLCTFIRPIPDMVVISVPIEEMSKLGPPPQSFIRFFHENGISIVVEKPMKAIATLNLMMEESRLVYGYFPPLTRKE